MISCIIKTNSVKKQEFRPTQRSSISATLNLPEIWARVISRVSSATIKSQGIPGVDSIQQLHDVGQPASSRSVFHISSQSSSLINTFLPL